MLAIKLQKIGKKHQPSFRLVIAEKRSKLGGPPVEDLGFYKEPAEGAKIAYPELTLRQAVSRLTKELLNRKAPPAMDRPIGIAECETIFCKFKSHIQGHYPVGLDTIEIGNALDGWGPLALRLKEFLPSGKFDNTID